MRWGNEKVMRPSQGFGTGEQGHLFYEEQMSKNEGNRETKPILRNRKQRIIKILMFRDRETKRFISGEHENRYPPTPGRATMINSICITIIFRLPGLFQVP